MKVWIWAFSLLGAVCLIGIALSLRTYGSWCPAWRHCQGVDCLAGELNLAHR